MKKFAFFIDEHTVKKLFSPIRTKRQLLNVLFSSIKLILLNNQPEEKYQAGKMILVVSKMSRLFFFTGTKYFSITFPLNIYESNEGILKITYKDQLVIDNKVSSELISLLMYDKLFTSNCGFEFIDTFFDEAKVRPIVWSLFLYLLMNEDGYIRYDYDEDREDGMLHPLNHYDVFYSSKPTFKIGLQNKISEESLIDFLSTETDCHFII
jgi:hypothetical protein